MCQLVANDSIKSALELRINNDKKDEFEDEIVLEKMPGFLEKGHVLYQDQISKIELKAVPSQYVTDLTKKTKVTVMASVLTVATINHDTQDMLDFNVKKKMLTMLVAIYLFSTFTEEMKTLNKKTTEKTSVEHNKILYKRNRMKESLKFEVVSGMEMVITKFQFRLLVPIWTQLIFLELIPFLFQEPGCYILSQLTMGNYLVMEWKCMLMWWMQNMVKV